MKKQRTLIIGIICITLVVGFYYFISTRDTQTKETELTEVQKVVLKDISGENYPSTPREVIKLYNRILCCYYNEEHSEEEFYQLADMAILLMDNELAAKNPKEQYYANVQKEIALYHENKKTINNASVCDTNEVKFDNRDGVEYAYVEASYFAKENGRFTKTYQEYVLRQDEEGKWKILAFQLKEGDSAEDDE